LKTWNYKAVNLELDLSKRIRKASLTQHFSPW